MSLDATAREANVRDSIRKYLVDTLTTLKGYAVTFDKGLNAPQIQGHEVVKWIAVQFGQFTLDNLSDHQIQLTCCTRNDPEGYQLAHLRDNTMGYLKDPGRIDLFNSYPTPWVKIGSLYVITDTESGQMEGPDKTKYKIIPFRVKWGAKT